MHKKYFPTSSVELAGKSVALATVVKVYGSAPPAR